MELSPELQSKFDQIAKAVFNENANQAQDIDLKLALKSLNAEIRLAIGFEILCNVHLNRRLSFDQFKTVIKLMFLELLTVSRKHIFSLFVTVHYSNLGK